MGKLIGLIILIGFLYYVFKIGFSVIRMFLGSLLGIQPEPRNTSSNQQKARQANKQTKTEPPTKKIITRDEGEYVDFEEIKD
jgi:hypothetical protein